MNKVMVTKKQMEIINRCKGFVDYDNLKNLLHIKKTGEFRGWVHPLNDMSIEQIVLAWHGHIEVSPEYVSFDEAMKAHDGGCLVSYHHGAGSKITESLQNRLKDSWLGDYSLKALRKGKWSIEGGR